MFRLRSRRFDPGHTEHTRNKRKEHRGAHKHSDREATRPLQIYRQTGRTLHTRLELIGQLCDTAPRRDTTRNDLSEYRQTKFSSKRPIGDMRRNGQLQHNSHPTRYRQKQARVDPSTYRPYRDITEKQIDRKKFKRYAQVLPSPNN